MGRGETQFAHTLHDLQGLVQVPFGDRKPVLDRFGVPLEAVQAGQMRLIANTVTGCERIIPEVSDPALITDLAIDIVYTKLLLPERSLKIMMLNI